LVEVICDTSFLVNIATKRIKNIDNLEIEIGQIQFVVPEAVKNELENLCDKESKRKEALSTLDFIKKLKIIPISGTFADESLISYIKEYGGTVATVDKELKNKVKNMGGSVISLSNNKIVLEP